MSSAFRIMMLITNPGPAAKASDIFTEHKLPVHYQLNAIGTASNEMINILGLGTTEKVLTIAFLSKRIADDIMIKLYHKLRLGAVNGGIAFTLPLDAMTKHVHRMMQSVDENNNENEKKGEFIMTDTKYSMISVMVEMGYSEQVMNAARSAGARGGTVVHSRAIENEEASSVWGVSLQEEKEIVMIVTTEETKNAVMSAISKECGIHSEAKGLVMSLPIENVIGIN